MAARRGGYSGVRDAKAEFRELEPAFKRLEAMKLECFPGGPHHAALDHAWQALRMAANVVTGEMEFYSRGIGGGDTGPIGRTREP